MANKTKTHMTWESEKKIITIGFTLALAILALLSFFTYRLFRANTENEAWVKHTYQVLQTNNELLSNLKDAETGQRGFVIADNEAFLEPFYRALERNSNLLQDLKQLTADNPNQQRRITQAEKLIEEKLRFSEQVIEKRRTLGLDTALAMISGGRGKQTMDEARKLLGEIEEEERLLLVTREQASDRTSKFITWSLIAGLAVSIVLFLLVYYLLKRQIKLRAAKEAELQESYEWFSKTLNSLGDAVVATDNNFKITYMNPVAEDLTGWSAADAKGKSVDLIYHAVHAVNRNKVEVPVISAISRKHVVSPEIIPILIRKDGRELYVDSRGAPIISSSGDVIGSALIFRDVTAQKELSDKLTSLNAELEEQVIAKTNELIRNEHRLKLTMDNMLEGAQLVDYNWRYLYINNMLVEQSGLPREKLIGSTMHAHYPDLESTDLFRYLKHSMEDRVARQFEYKFGFPKNVTRWFKVIVQPVPEGLFILSIDINERKKAEQESKDYTRTLEEMLFMTSHKVRQPVSQIMGIAHLLDHPLESQDELKRITSFMQEAVKSLDEVTREFTDFLYEQRQKRKQDGNP